MQIFGATLSSLFSSTSFDSETAGFKSASEKSSGARGEESGEETVGRVREIEIDGDRDRDRRRENAKERKKQEHAIMRTETTNKQQTISKQATKHIACRTRLAPAHINQARSHLVVQPLGRGTK